MRKISFSPPLKRGLFSMLALVALIFIGLGLSKAADAPFNQEFKVEYSGTGVEYHFVAPSTGQLNINFNAPSGINGDIDFLFTASDKKAVQLVSHDGVVDQWGPPYPVNIYNAVYNVTEGTEYYVKLPYYEGHITLSMTDGSGGGGTTDPDPGPGVDPDPDPGPGGFDTPDGYEEMPTVKGPLSNPQQTNATQISANGNFYYFEAPSEGKLVVWQWGSSRMDGHLWKIPFANDNWEPWGNQVEDTGSPLDTPTPNYITYPLAAGQQVYWYAKSSQGITYAIFAWEGTDVSTIPTLSLDTPTTVASNALYQFTATESGVLVVELSSPTSENVSFSTGLAALPAEQHFFYANSGHSQEVQALATTNGAQGWRVAFEVEQGVTYYVFNPTLNAVIFTLSMDPNGAVTPKLEAVQPLPGGIDNDNYESTITVQFYPAAVSIASVDFVYTDLLGQLQTIKNVQCDFLSGAYNIPRAKHMNMDGTKLHEAYDDPNATVFYQISKEEGAVQKYILHQVNYNGKPLAETAITAGVEIAPDGTLTLNYAIDTPPTLVSQVVPDPFYHEWAAGDPAGIMVLTYNKELNPEYTPEVNIIEGTQYYGSEPGENDQTWAVNPTHIKVEGNTVTVDFTGSDAILTAEESVDGVPTSIPWGPGRSNITIYVGGVMGMNNLPASYSGDPAFMPHVTYVSQDAPEPEPVVADIVKVTPAYGSVIYVEEDGSSSFEITFNQEVKINWVGTYNRMNRQHAATYETSPAFGEFAKVWKVIIPAKDIEEAMRDNDENASIFAYVEAEDKDGNLVLGSNSDYSSYDENRVDNNPDSFNLWFNVKHAENPGYPFVTSLEDGTNEAPLRSFTVSSEWGTINANNDNISDGEVTTNPFLGITVTGPDGFTANAESFDISLKSVTLDKSILVEGEYEIFFPYQAFTIVAPEDGGISKTYDSEERTFKFNVVLGDEIYDSQVDDIQLTAQPVHGETAEEAAPVSQDEIQNVILTWGGRDLELTGEGGLTVSGPNEYFADFGTDAHNFSIVDGNTIVIDMATVFAEIENDIKAQEGVVDNTYYNGVYKFTLAKKTVKIDGGLLGARAIADENVVYNDETNLYYDIAFAEAEKEALVFNDENWYPKANVKYYFTPETAGTLKWQIFENGDVTSTIVVGGIYEVYSDSDADLVTPTESDEMPDIFGSTFSYASYDLEADTEYYFMWNKNAESDSYALLVTWDGGEIDTPTGPANTLPIAEQFYPTANEKYYYTPTEDGTLKVELVDTEDTWMGNGFLYLNSDDSAVNPSDGDLTTPWEGATHGSWAEYALKAGVTYYVLWPKDNSGLEYPMLATWTVDDNGDDDGDDDDFTPNLTDPQLQWEDNDFYAEGNVNYYFTTKTGGTATFSPKQDGTVITTYIMGGLYKADGTEVKPTSFTGTDWGWAYEVSQLVYDLEPQTEYYFTWTKNDGTKEYVLYAEYTGEVYTKDDIETGVISIFGNDGVYRVYNINGVNVLNTEDPLELKNLEHGLYIVNGKKIIL